MKLSTCDYTFPLLTHENAIRLAAMMGFEGIDIGMMGNRSHLRPEYMSDNIKDIASKVKDMVSSVGIRVSDVFLIPWTDFETMSVNHPDTAERARSRDLFLKTLEFAKMLDSHSISTLPGIPWPEESFSASFNRAIEELSWRGEIAANAGIVFCVEPHIGSIIENPKDAVMLAESAPNVKLTLDYTHFIAKGLSEEQIEPLARYAGHVHARGANRHQLQARVKDNSIDYNRLVDVLKENGYDGWIAIEYVWTEWQNCNRCDNVSETLLLKQWIEAKLHGEQWVYPESTI